MQLQHLCPSVLLASLLAIAPAAQAGTFSYDCGMADVSCDQLFNDLVTDKFTQTFDHRRYRIMVYAETVTYSDQSGAAIALVGVTPRAKDGSTHNFRPNRWWRSMNSYRRIEGPYQRKENSKATIREAITAMMAACDDSPRCDILGD